MGPTMNNSSMDLDGWRDYFRTSKFDIFSVIEHAMLVASLDCPYEFRLKRDRMAEILFTCKIPRCSGCGESKGSRSRDDNHGGDHREVMEMGLNGNNNNDDDAGCGDAEALTDETEQESLLHEEVLRIREIVENSEEESDEVLLDSLGRLKLMCLSLETLTITDIAKPVKALRKHGSKDIRNLVRTLIDDWKTAVDEWLNETTAIAAAEATKESVKTSSVEEEEEEEGLPAPPLDEGAFLANPVSMELSQFFDGMDDDGYPQKCGKINKNQENGRKPRPEKMDVVPKQEFAGRYDPNAPNGHRKGELKRNQEPILRRQAPPSKPAGQSLVGEREPVRTKLAGQLKVKTEVMVQRKSDKGTIQKKPPMPRQQEKLNGNNEAPVREKLDAAKRKLYENYHEADNAKKQRTIRVVEQRDLPKQGLVQRNQQTRPGNEQHRQWINARR